MNENGLEGELEIREEVENFLLDTQDAWDKWKKLNES